MLNGLTARLHSMRLGLSAASVLSILAAVPASASITLDANSTATVVAGSTSLTLSHTLGSGGNRLVVCGVTLGYNDTALTSPVAPSMTFDGVAMTASIQAPTHALSSTSKIYSQIFYINDTGLGARLGAYNVVLTIPNAVTGGASAGCTSVFGASQSAPEATGVAYSGSSTPAVTVNLTTITAGDWIIDAFAGGYGSSGSVTPNSGQTQLYNVQSAAGSKTTGASNGGEVAGGSYELVATPGAVTVGWTPTVARQAYAAAAFAPAATTNYTVATAANPAGSGTITFNPSQGSYPGGSSVQLTANPGIGYVFSSFSGDVTGTTNPATLVVTGNKSVTANFTVAPCILTINVVGSGTVTPASGSSYACGTQVQVTATPANGYSFGQYSGALTGNTNPQTITLNNNSTVTATFVQGTSCTLSTSVTGSGTITVNPAGTVFACGTSLTVTANPATYYSLTGFSGALTGTTNPQTFVINANSTIGAAFAQTSYPIRVTLVGPGTVTQNPADTGNGYAPGTQVQLTAVPAAGANFTGFTGDATGTANPTTVTVNTTKNITATFVASTITQDAVSSGTTKATASTLSWQHKLGAGGSRAVVIAVGQTDTIASPDPSSVVTSVLFNGIYATPVPNSIVYGGTSGSVQTQLFYLLEPELPAAGTYTITVNLAGNVAGVQAGAVSFLNVNQGPPEAVITHKDTSGADLISTAITTLTNNAVVVDVVEDNNVAALTANSGQTLAWTGSAAVGTAGSSVKFVPTAGSTTLGWAGSASRLTHSLAAFPPATSFVPATYTLTTSVAGGTGGTLSTNPGLSAYPLSTGVLLTATPQTGYAFSGWTGDYTSTANPLPITMDANRNVVANFSSVATCTLTVNVVGSGTVTPAAGTYNCGAVIHFVATPGTNYSFTSYSGDFSSTDNPANFTITANSTVTAEFDPVPLCALNIATTGSGSVTPASGNYACGTALTLQATAAGGYGFSGYTGDIATTANPATLIITQNTSITANFTAGNACTLTASVTGQGKVTPAAGSWACGTTIAIEADPASKYLFNGWSGDLTTTTSPTALTLNTNKTVAAAFVVNIAGVTGDARVVTEPVYPPVCKVLTAFQTLSSPVESNPDTARVQAAINACPAGQAVQFSANGSANAFIIAPITLAAGVTMLVDPEVTILGSINSTDYACVASQSLCTPLIDVAANAAPAVGSGIMGLGVIDGRGGTTLTDLHKSWWATGSDARPRLVFLSSHSNTNPADNFTMYKITLKNSPKFEFSGIGNNLTIWGIKVIAPPDSPNTDGIDPSGSQNITITNSFISTGDDMIAMKAGNGHIANVTVSNNHLYSGHGITIGSETNAGLNNMLVVGNAIDNGFGGSSADSLRIKSDTSRGGEVYDVLYKNTCVNHGADTIVIDPYYSSQTGSLIPNFHDITFSNFHELIRDSSHKSTLTGYNTNGIVNPATITFDNVSFDGAIANDFKAPDNVNNAQFTFGPGPVNIASILTADAAVPSNLITVTNSISNSNAVLDCSTAFIYLAGDLTAPKSTVVAGTSPNITAVLQNVVSPLVAGTVAYPQQNAPTGSIQLLEGTTMVGTGTIGSRVTYINVPNIAAGTHTYTAKYVGDSNYSPLAFGSFTLVATNPAPVASNQSVTVAYNTATPVTLTATGSGTLTYTVVANPTHGTLTGTAPSLTYTPTAGYSGADSFTFKANNGTDSNIATVSLTVAAASGQQSQTITFSAPSTPVTYGASAIALGATASSGLPVTYSVSGPGSLSGSALSFTGAGTVIVTAAQTGSSSYTPAPAVQRTIVVNPTSLTVSVAGTPTRIYGQPNPTFAYTIGSFVNGDTQASAVTGAPSLTTSAVPKSPAGPYTILVAQGTLAASNYTFNVFNGQLTVTGNAAQSIAFPPLANFTHGLTVPLVAISSSGLPIAYSVTSGPAQISGNLLTITGTGAVSITAAQAGNTNFAPATSVTRSFTAQ